MILSKLLRRVVGGERFEGHFEYCDVFAANGLVELVPTGKPCSEDCAGHPGSKFLLGEFGTVREV